MVGEVHDELAQQGVVVLPRGEPQPGWLGREEHSDDVVRSIRQVRLADVPRRQVIRQGASPGPLRTRNHTLFPAAGVLRTPHSDVTAATSAMSRPVVDSSS